jgi:hypothetical protein
MTSFKSLPTEVYNSIFQYLSKPSQYQCMFVCKLWFSTAAQVYFSEFLLAINRPKMVFGLLHSPNVGKWIRALKIYGIHSTQYPFGKREFCQLIADMPYLKKLDLDNYDTQEHLQTLFRIPKYQLRNLQELHIGYSGVNNEIERLYILNNLRLCENIEHLRLQYFRIYFDAERLKVVQYLIQFKRLKHLIIVNSIKNGGISNLNLLSVVYACPFLHTLDFRSDFPALMNSELVKPQFKYLRSLTLGISDINSLYLNDIIYCISATALDSFELDIYEASLKHWIDDNIFEPFKALVRRISNCKNVKINIITLPERMTLASLVLKEATVSLWDIINTIQNNRSLFGCLIIDLDNVRFNRLNPCIEVINNQIIKMRTCLSYPNIANSNNSFTWDPFFCTTPTNYGLPFINSLCVDFTLFYSKSLRRMIQLLECLLSRCHWLKYLYIGSNVSSMLFCPEISQPHCSNATYKVQCIDTTTPVTTNTKANLKCASFESMQISSYLLQVMSILLNIQTIKISHCYYDRDTSGAIVLNLQEILYIPRLELNLDFWDQARQIFPLLIKIQMGDYSLFYQCGPHQCISSSQQPTIDNIFEYNIVININCQRIDTVSLYNAADTSFAVLEPWSDYLSSMSTELV